MNGNATTATHLSSASDSSKFYRGDKTWSNDLVGHLTVDGLTTSEDITFDTIASWPVASGETYPISSKGLVWAGSSDGARIFYRVDAANNGNLII
jgi:hypothetical protein